MAAPDHQLDAQIILAIAPSQVVSETGFFIASLDTGKLENAMASGVAACDSLHEQRQTANAVRDGFAYLRSADTLLELFTAAEAGVDLFVLQDSARTERDLALILERHVVDSARVAGFDLGRLAVIRGTFENAEEDLDSTLAGEKPIECPALNRVVL